MASRFLPKIDPYILAIVATAALASIFPCRGELANVADHATDVIVALLFFLYGARLSRESIVAGVTNVRLQGIVLVATFGLFPLVGVGLSHLLHLVAPETSKTPLVAGLVFVAVLPSTIQSSIAFTSMARGNIPAAICAASISNIVGIVVTPFLAALLVEANASSASSPLDHLGSIAKSLLLPFALGQIARRWIGPWLERRKAILGYVDRGSILTIVYVAFSEGVVAGIWHRLPPSNLVVLGVACAILLAIVMVVTTRVSRALRFSTEDEIAIVFCGSKKSLATGLAMAKVIFAGSAVSVVILPLMIFHQLQLMASAVLAGRYAQRPVDADTAPTASFDAE